MTNERIIYTTPGGSVCVVVPSGDIPIADVLAKDVPADAVNVRLATTADLPANRNYRAAWDDSNPENLIGVNAGKAAEIAHARRRLHRDVVFMPHLKVTSKNAQGVPLAANESADAALSAMTAYKETVDDVSQAAIDAAAAAGDVAAIEAAELAAGWLKPAGKSAQGVPFAGIAVGGRGGFMYSSQ